MDQFELTWRENLLKRTEARVESFLKKDSSNLILCSKNDIGVRLNGGRPGSRLAPEALMNVFKKLTASSAIEEHGFRFQDLKTSYNFGDFKKSQKDAALEIGSVLENFCAHKILHLGGGHDHIFPFLSALQSQPSLRERGLFIVNIDAHLDTRTDAPASSGTPFRQWAQCAEIPFHLVQIGIHSFANPQENYLPLESGRMDIVQETDYRQIVSKCESLRELGPCPQSQVLISLDSDALSSSCMSAVSAVNHRGLEAEHVDAIMDWAFEKCQKRLMGIYEYNPIYDDLSQKGARTIAVLMNKFFED